MSDAAPEPSFTREEAGIPAAAAFTREEAALPVASAFKDEVPHNPRTAPRKFGVWRFGVGQFSPHDDTRYSWTRVKAALLGAAVALFAAIAPARAQLAPNTVCEGNDSQTSAFSFCLPQTDVEGSIYWGDKYNNNFARADQAISSIANSVGSSTSSIQAQLNAELSSVSASTAAIAMSTASLQTQLTAEEQSVAASTASIASSTTSLKASINDLYTVKLSTGVQIPTNLVDLSTITTALNGKQATGSYLIGLTSDVLANGPGSAAAQVVHTQPGSVDFSTITTALNGKQASGSYSGVGSCSLPNVVTGLNANGAPTCAQPSDVSGTAASAAVASNLASGGAGQLPYQTASGATAFIPSMAQNGIILGVGTGVSPDTVTLAGSSNITIGYSGDHSQMIFSLTNPISVNTTGSAATLSAVLGTPDGGTGLSGIPNGEILYGNGGGSPMGKLPAMTARGIIIGSDSSWPSTTTVQGTASQVTVTQSPTALTFSLPDPINVGTSGNAATATQLASAGSTASSGYLCRGVDASGNCLPARVDQSLISGSTSPVNGGTIYSAGYINAVSGDGTATGPAGGGSAALTLATVNPNVGSCGDASHVCQVNPNGKGLTTSAAAVAIAIPESAVTNLPTDLAGKQPTGNYITNLVGDVVANGPGSVSASIQNDRITGPMVQLSTIPVGAINQSGASDQQLLTWVAADGRWEPKSAAASGVGGSGTAEFDAIWQNSGTIQKGNLLETSSGTSTGLPFQFTGTNIGSVGFSALPVGITSHTYVQIVGSTATTGNFSSCMGGSTITVTVPNLTPLPKVRLYIRALTANSSGGTGNDCYANFLQDGAWLSPYGAGISTSWVTEMGQTAGSATSNGWPMVMDTTLSPAAGTHSYCLQFRVGTASTCYFITGASEFGYYMEP